MLKRIGAEESGEFKAVASGTLPSGKPVVVNADGTVSVASETTITKAYGSVVTFTTSNTNYQRVAYDSSNNKIVIAYDDDSDNTGKAVVGTVDASNNSISFGTPVTFNNAQTQWIDIEFDSNANKIVIGYGDSGNSNYGTAIVGTVSGTSISFGSEVVFLSSYVSGIFMAFDTTANKMIIGYRDNSNSRGRAVVGTVSGTSISFGSAVTFESSYPNTDWNMVYDANADKTVFAYEVSGVGKAIVGTVSGTSISFGTSVTFDAAQVSYPTLAYNSVDKNVILAYRDSYSSGAKAVVGTVSGTSISFGSVNTVASTSGIFYIALGYNPQTNTVALEYGDTGNSNYGTIFEGTISGTTISFDSGTVFQESRTQWSDMVYDSSADRLVLTYEDYTNSGHGKSMVIKTGGVTKNLTSENYIGMSRGVVSESALSIGATSVVNTGTNGGQTIAYDTNSDRVVIAYKDTSNGHGKAVVGTVSGSGITFGTPVTFNAATTIGMQPSHGIAFDSSNNKVVIVYKDNGNSSYGTAIVGTVDPSDNSISYGSEAVFESAHTTFPTVVFDSSNNKVLISYSDYGDSSKGKAIVGTVSGTSISFGSAAEFEGGDVNHETLMSTFDSANNKVVIAYKDVGDSNKGKAVVATISGTSVSFGTPVEFTASDFVHSSITFDSTSNKVILVYRDSGNSGYGTAKAGTVSGTSISFGNAIIYNSGDSQRNSVSYSPTADKSVVFFRDGAASDIGKLVELTVSGTSITASSIQQFSATTTSASSSVFDPDNNVVVNAYIDEGNTTDLETVQVTGTTIIRGQATNGQAASIDIIGSVSDNQIGLTTGQQYFVQTDGTIGTTAATPSVLAGTAISATELVVKT
jgi:hypothetical protein